MYGTFRKIDNPSIVISVTSRKKRKAYGGTRWVNSNWYRCQNRGTENYSCSIHKDKLEQDFERVD